LHATGPRRGGTGYHGSPHANGLSHGPGNPRGREIRRGEDPGQLSWCRTWSKKSRLSRRRGARRCHVTLQGAGAWSLGMVVPGAQAPHPRGPGAGVPRGSRDLAYVLSRLPCVLDDFKKNLEKKWGEGHVRRSCDFCKKILTKSKKRPKS
jgi:hypothetical protein